MNATDVKSSSDISNENSSDEGGVPNLWLDLLYEFLDDFESLSADLQLAVIARLHQAGHEAKAEELWSKVKNRRTND